MILDAITSSPFNVFFTIVLGLGFVYWYYRKPPSSSSGSSGTSAFSSSRSYANTLGSRSTIGIGAGVTDEELQRTIAQIERQERDMIRQEQDAAYQQSLKADREKKLKREEEERDKEARERAKREKEAKEQELHDKLMKLRSEIITKLPKKLEFNSTDSVKLVFKLPDGTRVTQEFRKEDKIKYLYWYVFSLNNSPLQFKMTTNFPKRDLPGRPPVPEDFNDTSAQDTNSIEPNCEQTLEEAGLTETQIIFVYDLEA